MAEIVAYQSRILVKAGDHVQGRGPCQSRSPPIRPRRFCYLLMITTPKMMHAAPSTRKKLISRTGTPNKPK